MVLASRDFVSPVDLIATTTAFFDGQIDLDPASSEEQPKPTALFQKNLQFKKSAQRVWLELCYQKWLKREFQQGITLITSSEVALIVTQKIGLDLPMCILKDKPRLLTDDENLKPLKSTRVIGFIFYFPPPEELEENIRRFYSFYSTLGRVYS